MESLSTSLYLEQRLNMKISTRFLNMVILLSSIAFLTGITRLMLDIRFVPEVFSAMPEDQPMQTGPVLLLFVVLYGVWLCALLDASRNSRRGLIALIVANLVLAFGWGFSTVVALCPTPCPVAYPLTDLVTWANVIIGLIAAAAGGLYLRSTSQSASRSGSSTAMQEA
jgi:hypothetical protein